MEELGIETSASMQAVEPTITDALAEKQALRQEMAQEEDTYLRYKKLQRHLDFLSTMEGCVVCSVLCSSFACPPLPPCPPLTPSHCSACALFFDKKNSLFVQQKDEQRNLKRELIRAQEEVKRIQSVPLVIGQFLEAIDENTGIVGSTTGSNYVVRILSTIDRELLKPSSSVALHRHSNSLVDVLPPEADSTIAMLGEHDKPKETYNDVGGLDVQKQEIREAVELPLTEFDLYKRIGIDPPRGVLLYGPPGTGKTMLVRAVANATTASFIRVNGSEFVQKYLGEGPRMVRDVFRLARENAPAIVFIDEIDAIATKRFDAQTGADREVQRILLELLNQMDGFDQDANVKVIMATNRADTLDPALLRPGRLDRKIEFPNPSRRERRLIFQTITGKMNLAPDVDLEDFVGRPDRISAADIASICQAAGLQAVRKNRYVILPADFEEAWKQTVKKADAGRLDFYQ